VDDTRIYAELKPLIALQQQAAGFTFLPRQPVHSVLSGRHGSRLRGRGLNFEELRHYRYGDDIRTMDWKVSNRTGKPHVRVFSEEKERPVLLLVDQRLNMFFGSVHKMKSVVAAELAAIAAWRVLASGDRVGGLIFNDTTIEEVAPQRSRNTVLQLLHRVIRQNHQLRADADTPPNAAQLNHALAAAERLCGHDYLIVLISDMSGWDAESLKRVKRLARHNDLLAGLVFDPLEQELPADTRLLLSDGQLQMEVDTRADQLAAQFRADFDSGVSGLQQELGKHHIPVLPIDTVAPVAVQLRQILGAKLAQQHRAG